MTATPKSLVSGAYVANTAEAIYTANNVRTVIHNMTLTNRSTNPVIVSVYKVPAGDSPSVLNVVYYERTLQPKETFLCPAMDGKICEDGQAIGAEANASSAIVVDLNGVEFSG